MAGEGAQHKSIISGFSPKTICDWEIGQRFNPGSQAGLGPWRWLLNWNCRGTRWHNFLFSPARYGCMADRDWDGKAAANCEFRHFPHSNPRKTHDNSTHAPRGSLSTQFHWVSNQFWVRKVLPFIARGPTQVSRVKIQSEFTGKALENSTCPERAN